MASSGPAALTTFSASGIRVFQPWPPTCPAASLTHPVTPPLRTAPQPAVPCLCRKGRRWRDTVGSGCLWPCPGAAVSRLHPTAHRMGRPVTIPGRNGGLTGVTALCSEGPLRGRKGSSRQAHPWVPSWVRVSAPALPGGNLGGRIVPGRPSCRPRLHPWGALLLRFPRGPLRGAQSVCVGLECAFATSSREPCPQDPAVGTPARQPLSLSARPGVCAECSQG